MNEIAKRFLTVLSNFPYDSDFWEPINRLLGSYSVKKMPQMSQNQDRPGSINGTYLSPFHQLFLKSGHFDIEGKRANYQALLCLPFTNDSKSQNVSYVLKSNH